MQADLESLKVDLDIASNFFVQNPDTKEMPFMHSFPKNACERSAALLMVVLKKKYKNSQVALVRGRSRATGEMHFWLEIDNLVMDPTAHQFPEYSAPFVSSKPSPLEKQFPRDLELNNLHNDTDLPTNSGGRWNAAFTALYEALIVQRPF